MQLDGDLAVGGDRALLGRYVQHCPCGPSSCISEYLSEHEVEGQMFLVLKDK